MTFYTLGKRSDLPRIISDCSRPTPDPQNLSVPDLAPAKHKFQNGRQEDRSSAWPRAAGSASCPSNPCIDYLVSVLYSFITICWMWKLPVFAVDGCKHWKRCNDCSEPKIRTSAQRSQNKTEVYLFVVTVILEHWKILYLNTTVSAPWTRACLTGNFTLASALVPRCFGAFPSHVSLACANDPLKKKMKER